MKICIVGLGAIGGQLAAWLHARLPGDRVQLSALARGATLQSVRTQGLIAESADGAEGEYRVPLRVAANAAELGPQDLVILAVKGPALAAVAPAVAELIGGDGHVLTAMNGVPWWFFDGLGGPCEGWTVHSVDPGGAVRALLPASRVIGGVVHLSSSTPAPGRVRHVSGSGLIVGRPAGPRDAVLDTAAALLADAGLAVTVSERIQRDVWFKLWGNMTINPVSALTGATADRILDDALVRGFCSAVMREAQAIGAAFGIAIDQQPEQRHAVTRKLGAFRSSMLQDLEAGRAMEVDALVGAVREIGQRLSIATPHIDALLGLVRLLAQQRGLWSPPALPAP
jgi:2-dehydropantoate 2-reductase